MIERQTVQAGSILVLLLSAAMLFNYVDRGVVSTAAPLMRRDLGLSATEFGLAISAFFWIYAPSQLVVGWLCDRFSVYRLLAVGMAVCAVSTALTGWVGGLASLILLRLLLGLGESVAFPGCSKIIARHVPNDQRGAANSMVAAALATGPAFGTLIGGLLMVSLGWRMMFVAFAICTLGWLLPWGMVTAHFKEERPQDRDNIVPLSRLLRTPALWTMSCGHFVGNLTLYFMMTWLPLYLVEVRHMSITRMTILMTSIYLAQAMSALFAGCWSDRLVTRGCHEGMIRKAFLVVGMAGVGAAAFVVPYASSPTAFTVSFICIGIFQGFNGGNIFALAQIFAGPKVAGTWVGVQNTISNMAGIIGPVATGLIIDRAGGYSNAFLFAATTALLGGLWFLFALGRPEQIKDY